MNRVKTTTVSHLRQQKYGLDNNTERKKGRDRDRERMQNRSLLVELKMQKIGEVNEIEKQTENGDRENLEKARFGSV